MEALAEQLRAFVDLPLEAEDDERAAQYFNLSRLRGIQGSNTDFLICAATIRPDPSCREVSAARL
ncbi:MAG: hypothetical protein O2782_09685 [bacterium]|nr:hypothetical protein [bacterium]